MTITKRLVKSCFRDTFWGASTIGWSVLLPHIPVAVLGVTLTIDAVVGTSRAVSNVAKKMADQRKRVRAESSRAEQIRRDQEYRAKNPPPPKPKPLTRVELAGQAHAVFKNDELIAGLIEDEDTREMALQQANMKYHRRLEELMNRA